MNITKDSDKILSFLVKDDNINYKYHKPIGKSKHIFKVLYDKLSKASTLIKETGASEVTKITNPEQIVKPKDYDNRSFPAKIMDHIGQHSKTQYLYTVNSNTSSNSSLNSSLFSRTIKVYFVDEHNEPILDKNKSADCFKKMLYWFYILNSCASRTCSQTITIYIYLSSVKKELPVHSSIIIDQNHANTGFTRNCTVNSEICIFREEEWFKVFLHESFHNFSLDFSDMNIDHINKQILQLFPLANSEVTAYEAYTEFWAEIMNACILAISLKGNTLGKNGVIGVTTPTLNEFLRITEFIINCERNFGMYQLVKVLKHMNLSYFDLIKREERNTQTDLKQNNPDRKRNCYKENTNVLSYYVLKNILLNNYNEFLDWCDQNNTNIFQFVKTEEHLQMFYKFIEKHYKTKDMLELIDHAEKLKSIDPFICKSMRMTCCESN
jgi:hypothetical protein